MIDLGGTARYADEKILRCLHPVEDNKSWSEQQSYLGMRFIYSVKHSPQEPSKTFFFAYVCKSILVSNHTHDK